MARIICSILSSTFMAVSPLLPQPSSACFPPGRANTFYDGIEDRAFFPRTRLALRKQASGTGETLIEKLISEPVSTVLI